MEFEINIDKINIDNLQYIAWSLLFTAIGLYGLFIKMGQKSRLAFLPYVNLAKLGDMIDMPKTGIIAAFFGIIDFGANSIDIYLQNHLMDDTFLMTIFVVYICIHYIYILFRTILLNRLRKDFGRKWQWMIPFLFVPGLTLAYWGYSKRIQV